MDKVIRALTSIPAFIADLFSEHPVVAVAGLLIFLLALMVPGRIGSLIRKIVILANILFAMAGGFMGRAQNGHEIICLSAISLIILLIVRLIVRIVNAINKRKRDARIEERALAKAAKRRGSFRKRQARSGETSTDDFVPPEDSQIEIRQVIENEINEGKARNEAALAASMPDPDTDGQEEEMIDFDSDSLPEGVFYARPKTSSPESARLLLENDVQSALNRLKELQDSGLLTDEEFEIKKAELLARLD